MTQANKEPIAITRARADDLDAVRALLARCALDARDLERALPHVFVARAGGDLVGCGALEVLGAEALLRSLAVAPEHRGRRVARAIWQRLRQEARDHDVRDIYLLTTTAAAVFQRWGFASVAREAVTASVRATSQFATLCPASAVVMRRAAGT